MQKYINNNRGLTLVEILAALIILSLVFIAFMSFFSQSAKFTMHNKETLTAVQVAEDVVGKIRTKNSFESLSGITLNDNPIPINELTGEELQNGVPYIYLPTNAPFEVTITLFDGPEKKYLKKATIKVESHTEKSIKNSSFNTEMYFEVDAIGQ